ncbi:hypothetical protein GQ600_6564 [Phytophthora cactorum]|nr:hypothetical protein GQ600_6564 [Phytophthora cactorum]
MEVALKMLEEDAQLRADSSLRLFSVCSHHPPGTGSKPQEFEVLIRSPHQVGNLQALSNTLQHKGTMEYVQRSAQVLFTTEFIILIEFTEVIIPFIYSELLRTMFQLPNRVFYPQIRQLDRNTLAQMIGNIAIYGLMELVSFVAMSVLLKRKLGISTLHQLAFVLDRERRMVQSNLFLWICYTIQNSLDHNGTRFLFFLLCCAHLTKCTVYDYALKVRILAGNSAGCRTNAAENKRFHNPQF